VKTIRGTRRALIALALFAVAIAGFAVLRPVRTQDTWAWLEAGRPDAFTKPITPTWIDCGSLIRPVTYPGMRPVGQRDFAAIPSDGGFRRMDCQAAHKPWRAVAALAGIPLSVSSLESN
jgi:hypothetical protein